jgi:hypothetical protein
MIGFIEDIMNEFDKKIDIYDYPFLKIKNDKFIDRQLNNDEMVEHFIKNFNNNNYDYVFWFMLPELKIFSKIKKNIPAKFIFYNFDDPASFSRDMIYYGKDIDFFINPNNKNKIKYDILLNKNTFVIPKYTYSIDIQKGNETIIIIDNYNYYDDNEKNIMDEYLSKIKKTFKNIKLYGNYDLEYVYPNIYEDEIEDFHEDELFSNVSNIFYLDFSMHIKKVSSDFITKLKNSHFKNIYFNPNISNDIDNLNIISVDDIHKNIHDIYNTNITNENDLDNYDIENFVDKIIKLLDY